MSSFFKKLFIMQVIYYLSLNMKPEVLEPGAGAGVGGEGGGVVAETTRWKDPTRGLRACDLDFPNSLSPSLSQGPEGLLPIPLQGMKCFPSDSHKEGK